MKSLLSSILILFWLTNTTQAQNLIKNNKFKAGTENWEVLSAEKDLPIEAQTIEYSQYYDSYGLADNYTNTSFVELDATSAIQQKINTDNSDNYTLIFAYAHRPNAGDKKLVVTADQTVIHTETIKNNASIGKFKYKHIYFDAPSNTTKLSFYAVSINGPDDQGVLLTDISCEKTDAINLRNSNTNHTRKTH